MNDEAFTPKCTAFLAALRALCAAHGVTLSTSGYDGLQVWDRGPDADPLHCAGIEDRTKRPNAAPPPPV